MSVPATASKEDQAARRHRERHLRWRNLTPSVTRVLSSLVNELLVPTLESRGFRYVGFHLGDANDSVSGSDISLERHDGKYLDSVTFNFEKYKSPRFQIHLSRRGASAHDFIHSGNLVSKGTQYYHFWGKPWWLPTRLWPEAAAKRTVKKIEACLDQAVRFIEDGTRGDNISKKVVTSGQKSGPAYDA
jgi:hypothetical protein